MNNGFRSLEAMQEAMARYDAKKARILEAYSGENLPAAAVPVGSTLSPVQRAVEFHGAERLLAAMSLNDIVNFVEQHGRVTMTKQLFNDLMDELGEARRRREKERPAPKEEDYSTWYNPDVD